MTDASRSFLLESPERLERLRRVIATALAGNDFYAGRLRDAGLDASVESLAAFTDRMPFTTKDDLVADQRTAPPYGTNLSYPPNRYTRLHQTSATSGRRPLRWLDTAEDWDWMCDGWVEVLRAAGVTPDDRMLVAFSFGPFIGLWLGFDAGTRLGCLTIPGGAMDSATRLKVLLEHRATVLCCTPTYALRLGEVARTEGIDLSTCDVRAIVVGGEPGASVPGTRERMKDLWPTAHLFDHYGMTEIGPATYQCPQCPGAVHVLDSLLCEIIDPETGAALPTGDDRPGELVMTTLGRAGSPVLRYRTGDLARALPIERCACGRTTLQLAGGVIGRADDMVVIRGVNLYPSVVDEIVRSVEGVSEYRVEIDTRPALADVLVTVEADETLADPDAVCSGVQAAFRDTYSLRIRATAVAAGTLPRFELKARRWIKQ